jgi:hypothetical protein
MTGQQQKQLWPHENVSNVGKKCSISVSSGVLHFLCHLS